jgi:hypothetical protein
VPQLRATLAGLVDATPDTALDRGGQFGTDVRVRHLIGLDPARQAVALADRVEPGMQLAFCRRDVQAARRDLVRICAEIRDELETRAASAAGARPPAARGRPARRASPARCTSAAPAAAGRTSARRRPSCKIVQHALGDVPLVGFFAGGEIARHHLYGYTGVLTVFTPAAGGVVHGAGQPGLAARDAAHRPDAARRVRPPALPRRPPAAPPRALCGRRAGPRRGGDALK